MRLQTPLPEQEGATDGIEMDLEALSTKDIAYHITLFDWDLFWAVHEYELLYHTFGRHHFGKVGSISMEFRWVTKLGANRHKIDLNGRRCFGIIPHLSWPLGNDLDEELPI